ncbi:MAG: glycosyltransferase family 4 protein [Bryobacteraceae bacterium]
MSTVQSNFRPSAAVFMPFYTGVRGGPDVAAMWLVESLCRDYDVTLVTTRHFDLDFFNRFAGTSLTRGQFRVIEAPSLPLPSGSPMAALQGPLFQRFARRCARDFDVPISAMNVLDLGVPAIHFLADLIWLDLQSAVSEPTSAAGRAQSPLRRIYHGLCRRLYAPSGRDPLREDMVVSSSRWMSAALRNAFGIESPVIHPPVPTTPVAVPWEERRPDFVWLGRIAPIKNLEVAIAIVDGIRKAGFDCKLHVVGKADDKKYGAAMKALAERAGGWTVFEGPLYGERKDRFLAGFRYALHTCWEDNFPITLIESIKSGCLSFGPDTFGSAEILNHEALTFPTVEEAVRKIAGTLPDAGRVAALREHLRARGEEFSADIFRRSVLRVAAKFIEQRAECARQV